VITADHLGAFRYGMKCFFEEGRALARLSHPNVIRVLNFFRANETVHMVMEYEHGRTLQEFIQKHQGHISERFIRGVFTRMLNGLREVHSNKLLHLDLKPSNIYLRADNTPVLIDFGAARQTLITDQPMLKPMYTPGFASPEHYGSRKDLGPWSDIYSVGASMYACLAGSAPQAADARLKKDTLPRPCCAGMASFQTACSKSSTGASTSTIFTVRKASLPCKRRSSRPLRRRGRKAIRTGSVALSRKSESRCHEIHHLSGEPPGRPCQQRRPDHVLLLARCLLMVVADGMGASLRRDCGTDRRPDAGRFLPA
jgi:serine/threonine protein kinase